MKALRLLAAAVLIGAMVLPSFASAADVWVNGYYRTNGTYVSGYYRSSPTTSSAPIKSTYKAPAASAYQTVYGGYKSYGALYCNSGYYQQSSSCIAAPAHATASGGYTFTCNIGYQKSGSSCVATPSYNTYSNSNYYTNVDGNKIHSPIYTPTAPAGASAKCRDGTYSFSQHRSGTCSGHKGVSSWL